MLQLFRASPSMVHALYEMILESAEESGLRHEVTTSPAQLLRDGFGSHPVFEALIAQDEETPVGFALWFPMYSAWKGRKSLYLEDLYVRPLWRRRGIAMLLFNELARIALTSQANLAWECDRERLDLRHLFTHIGALDRSHKVSFYMEAPEIRQHLQDRAS